MARRLRRAEEDDFEASGTWAEHRKVEDYDDSWIDEVETYYINHPSDFSADKVYKIKETQARRGRRVDKFSNVLDHMVAHIKNKVGKELVKELGKSRREEVTEAKKRVPSNAAVVIVKRNRRRYLFYRDVSTGKFVKPEKEVASEQNKEEV